MYPLICISTSTVYACGQGDVILYIILYYPVESYRLNSHTERIIQDNGQDDVTLPVNLSAGLVEAVVPALRVRSSCPLSVIILLNHTD